MLKFLGKLLDSNEKEISRLRKIVEQVGTREAEMKKLKEPGFAKKPQSLKNDSATVKI